MKNSINVAEIMKKAHAAAKAWNEDKTSRGSLKYSDIFGVCLREQWKREKLRASLPTVDAARAELDRGNADKLFERIAPASGYCISYYVKRSHAEVENPATVDDLMRRAAEDIRQETICRVWDALTTGKGATRKDGTPRDMLGIIYNAAASAIMRTRRDIIKHATAASTDKDGNTIIDTYATPHALKQTQDPETRAINADTIREVISLISDAYRKDALIILRAELEGYKPADYYKYLTHGKNGKGEINKMYIKRVKDAIKRAAFEHPFIFED